MVGFAVVVLACAVQVKANQSVSPGTLRDLLVLGMTALHGWGVQPPGLHHDDTLATLAGAEAIFVPLIAGLCIAAFTRRETGEQGGSARPDPALHVSFRPLALPRQ